MDWTQDRIKLTRGAEQSRDREAP